MAELAPEYIFGQTEPLFMASPELPNEQPDRIAIDISELPEFGFVAKRARQIGEAIRDERMQLLRDGEFDAVPMPIDMTGTARKVVVAEEQYGSSSPEARNWHAALLGDAERQIAEVTSKMTWGYFKPLVHKFDADQQTFLAYEHSVRQITENGISPMAEAEDVERSINDYVAERTDEAFIQSPYADDFILLTISDCADWAIADYEADKAAGNVKKAYGGYVPDLEKRMIRVVSFDTTKQERYVEQVAISGTVIDSEGILETLQILGVTEPGQELSKTELHGTRIMIPEHIMKSVLDFVSLADEVTSQKIGQNVFMGELVNSDRKLSYGEVPAEADRRNGEYANVVTDLAEKMLQLERDGVDKWQTEMHVNAYLKNKLLEVVKANPEQARLIFDDATANGLAQALEYRQRGMFEQARVLETQIEAMAPAVSSCGAGSCGLEAVDTKTSLVLKKELGGKEGDNVLKDKVRSCPGCGKKKLIYVFNDKEVRTKCLSCDEENLKKTA